MYEDDTNVVVVVDDDDDDGQLDATAACELGAALYRSVVVCCAPTLMLDVTAGGPTTSLSKLFR